MVPKLFHHIRRPAFSLLIMIFAAANFIFWMTYNGYPPRHDVEWGDYAANAIDPEQEVDTPMTYKQLKALEKEYNKALELQQTINEGRSGDDLQMLFIGFAELNECLGCNTVDSFIKGVKQAWISLITCCYPDSVLRMSEPITWSAATPLDRCQ